jgi:hypothetical protein
MRSKTGKEMYQVWFFTAETATVLVAAKTRDEAIKTLRDAKFHVGTDEDSFYSITRLKNVFCADGPRVIKQMSFKEEPL